MLDELPGPQLEHADAPASEKVPGAHTVEHVAWPVSELAVPAGQLEQAAAPALEKVPAAQAAQVRAPEAALVPAAHGVQTCSAAVTDVTPG